MKGFVNFKDIWYKYVPSGQGTTERWIISNSEDGTEALNIYPADSWRIDQAITHFLNQLKNEATTRREGKTNPKGKRKGKI